MMRKILLAGLLVTAACTFAQELRVSAFRHVGPLPLQKPVILDTTDVNGRPFKEDELLATPLSLSQVRHGQAFSGVVLPKGADGRPALHLAAFNFTNSAFTKATFVVTGLSHHELYLDGKKVQGERELQPGTHEVVIKALTTAASSDSLNVKVVPTVEGSIALDADGSKRLYTMNEVLHARRYRGASLSPDGKWMIVTTAQTQPGGQTHTRTEVRATATGRVVDERDGVTWMPCTNRYYYTRERDGRRQLVTVDPATKAESVLADDLPKGYFTMTPTEDRLIFSITDEGPKENV